MSDTSDRSKLLCAALSSITGAHVLPWEEYQMRMNSDSDKGSFHGKLDAKSVLSLCTRKQRPAGHDAKPGAVTKPRVPTGATFPVTLSSITGKIARLEVSAEDTLSDIQNQIATLEGIPPSEQRVTFASRQLELGVPVSDYGIQRDSRLQLILKLRGGAYRIYGLKDTSLDPEYDFDFTNVDDTGKSFSRGGLDYERPIGFRRFGIRVRGRYESDVWLGENGDRRASSNCEWPVSYHGTKLENVSSIVEGGYDVTLGKRSVHGEGIYTAPNIEIAYCYASEFSYDGKEYVVVLQNRVNTDSLQRFNVGCGEVWLSASDKDVRPYGICIGRTDKLKDIYTSKAMKHMQSRPTEDPYAK